MEDFNESTVNAEPVETVEPQETEQDINTTESVNEEVTTSTVDEKPVQTQEENANYANIRRDAEAKSYAKAQDDMVASMYGESHGIYTKADYDQAIQAQEEANKVQEYVQNNIPEEYAKELVESKRFREQFETEQATKAKDAVSQKQFNEFFEAYPGTDPNSINQEVWNQYNAGVPLKIAYAAQQENASLKAELAEYKKGQQTQKTNNENASTSTGSTTGNGNSPTGFIAK